MPAPAIVGKSLSVGAAVPEESVATKVPVELESEEVLLPEEDEASVADADVEAAVVLLDREVDSAVDSAVEEAALLLLVSSSSSWSLRSGRSLSSACALTMGAPARARSASNCVFLARRTMFVAVACV